MTAAFGHSLADVLFDLEKPFQCAHVPEARRRIQCATAMLANRRIAQKSHRRQIGEIQDVLFKTMKLRPRRSTSLHSFTLTSTLVQNGGNCMGLSCAFAAVAESVGVNVRPLLFDAHMAVCVELNGVTHQLEVSQRPYRPVVLTSAEIQPRILEGRALNAAELTAVHCSNQAAHVYAPRFEYGIAHALLEQALEVFPAYSGAWINLSALYLLQQRSADAMRCLEHVLASSASGPYWRHAMAMANWIACGELPTRATRA